MVAGRCQNLFESSRVVIPAAMDNTANDDFASLFAYSMDTHTTAAMVDEVVGTCTNNQHLQVFGDYADYMQCEANDESEQDNFDDIEQPSTDDGGGGGEDVRDPFDPRCRIPLPNLYGNYIMFDSTTFIRRRNERERTRVRNVNEGFDKLRNHLPLVAGQRDKRLSKVETLRLAISYIKHLQTLLNQDNVTTGGHN